MMHLGIGKPEAFVLHGIMRVLQEDWSGEGEYDGFTEDQEQPPTRVLGHSFNCLGTTKLPKFCLLHSCV